MEAVYEKYPDSPDVAAVYVDSMANLFPFAMWYPDGAPTDDTYTPRILAVLDKALSLFPGHLGLNHYNIHAREGCEEPGSALPSAVLFDNLNLTAGIYIRV